VESGGQQQQGVKREPAATGATPFGTSALQTQQPEDLQAADATSMAAAAAALDVAELEQLKCLLALHALCVADVQVWPTCYTVLACSC
jgi:hypothetical protein